MGNYILLGADDRGSAVRQAIFREIVEGTTPNARFLSLVSLCGAGDPVHRLLYGSKLPRLLARAPKLAARVDRAAKASLVRHQANVRLDRVRPLLFEGRTDFLFCPSTLLSRAPGALVRDLRAKCPDSRMLFYLIDGVSRLAHVNGMTEAELLAYLSLFDAVYSYDPADAARWPELIRHIDIPLWRSPEAPPAVCEREVYFCGRDKGRSALLLAVRDRLAAAGLGFRAHIARYRPGDYPADCPDIRLIQWMPYERTVSELLRANCVLELMAERNAGPTLRYKEAVLYNKKLLTDNPDIEGLPYYDPRWMRVFRTAEDIDLDWLRAVEPVDYGYRGDFSLETFLRRLDAFEARAAE